MSQNTIRARFGTSVARFYVIIAVLLRLFKENITGFSNFKSTYTDTYADDLKRELESAKALPTTGVSTSERKKARNETKAASKKVREKWQDGKKYANGTYDQPDLDVMLREAGAEYYAAGAVQWDSVQAMGEAMNKFLPKYKDDLMTKGAMPVEFIRDFADLVTDYTDKLQIFKAANNSKQLAVAAKMKANNKLYDKVIAICEDATSVFRNDLTLKRLFSYSYQLSMAKGGAASFKGTITLNGVPVEGATIETADGKSAVSDKFGKFKITKMEHGDWIFVIRKAGLVTQELAVTLKPSTSKTVKVAMVAIVVMEAA